MRRAAKTDRNQPEIVKAAWACQQCGGPFPRKKVTRGQKYCSSACFGLAFRATHVRAQVACAHCGENFAVSPSMRRKFCSYECHLASGGALRAGEAAVRSRMRYGAKKDANHNEVVAALQKVGVSVLDMSAVGSGMPDLICGFRGATYLMEIKNPKTAYGKRGLNKKQRDWHEAWTGGKCVVVSSVAEALAAIGVSA